MSKRKMFTRISRARLVFLRLQDADPPTIFAGLLHIVALRGYKPGFAAFKFKEIFGFWPDFKKSPEPVTPSSDLMTWLANQRRNFGARMKRIDAKKAKENAFTLARIEAMLADIEASAAVLRAAGIDYSHSADAEVFGVVDRIERKMVEHGAKGFLVQDDLPIAAE